MKNYQEYLKEFTERVIYTMQYDDDNEVSYNDLFEYFALSPKHLINMTLLKEFEERKIAIPCAQFLRCDENLIALFGNEHIARYEDIKDNAYNKVNCQLRELVNNQISICFAYDRTNIREFLKSTEKDVVEFLKDVFNLIFEKLDRNIDRGVEHG